MQGAPCHPDALGKQPRAVCESSREKSSFPELVGAPAAPWGPSLIFQPLGMPGSRNIPGKQRALQDIAQKCLAPFVPNPTQGVEKVVGLLNKSQPKLLSRFHKVRA